jgi:hypothetical protein
MMQMTMRGHLPPSRLKEKNRRQGNARRPSDHVCQMKTGPLQIEAKEESQQFVHSHYHLGDTQGAQVQNKNLLQKVGFICIDLQNVGAVH